MTPKIKNLITRTITGVLFVAIMVTCFLRPVGMVFVFALITSLSLWEYTGLVNENKGTSVNRFISTVAGTYFFLAVAGVNSGFIATNAVFVPYLLTIVYLFVSELYTKAKDPINNWAYTMFGQMYIALPLSMINVLAFRQADNQIYFYYLLPLSVFIFLWTNDTGAYCSGSLFGKHKLSPNLSPKKTIEGSVGGILFCVGASFLYALVFHKEFLAFVIPFAILGSIISQIGDIFASAFKRAMNIKDYGNLIPGHGGILDRADSVIFTTSFVYVTALLLK